MQGLGVPMHAPELEGAGPTPTVDSSPRAADSSPRGECLQGQGPAGWSCPTGQVTSVLRSSALLLRGSAHPPCHLSRLCLVLGKQKRMLGACASVCIPPSPLLPPPLHPPVIHHPSSLNLLSIFHPSLHPPIIHPSIHRPFSLHPSSIHLAIHPRPSLPPPSIPKSS